MDVPRLPATRRAQPSGRLVAAIWLYSLMSLVQVSQAAWPAAVARASPLGFADVCVPAGRDAETVEQVSLGPEGVLRGRVVDVTNGVVCDQVAGLRVSLVCGHRVVAVTTTDAEGRFAVQNLPAERYTVVVHAAGTVHRRFCRVWSPRAAPRQAVGRITVPLGGPVVRGNGPSPFPIMTLRQAAVVVGIAGGAIAAPVIYHNTRIDNRVPASP